MKVAVTGAGGFVGRELVRTLLLGGPHEGERPIERLVHFDRAPSGLDDSRIVEVIGDVADPACRALALDSGCDCLFHLAAVPGGLAERDPDLSARVNLDATLALAREAAALGVRLVYASSIAVLGTPDEPVSDATVPMPTTVYGRHKRAVECELAELGASQGLRFAALRLPGIVARPRGDVGLKSAFMSDLFHALAAGETFVSPVSPSATLWLMSVGRAAANLAHAGRPEAIEALGEEAVTLPAIHTSMAALVAAVARACGVSPTQVGYAPDEALEAVFGRLPPLSAAAAQAAGFADDGDLDTLVATTLQSLHG